MPNIDINSNVPRLQFTASASQKIFSLNFIVFDEGDLVVLVDGVKQVLTTNYTVSDTENEDGATVTFVTPLTGGELVTIFRQTTISRASQYQQDGRFDAAPLERDLDFITTILQETSLNISRALTVNAEDTITVELPTAEANKVLTWSPGADAVINGPTTTQITNAESNASAAAASAAAASTSEGNAATSESNASASAIAAQAAVNSAPFRDTITLTNADSPYTILTIQNGFFFSLDTSGGDIVLNLPQISSLTLPFNQRFKKETSDANTVTINTFAGDEFGDGTTSKIIATVGGLDVIAEDDTAPDSWKTALFGASAGNMSVDTFVDGVDYTSGTTTTLTLSAVAGSENNLWVTFDGVSQHKTEYGLAGTTLTFSSPIPLGVAEVEVQFGTTLSIGTPSDTSVTFAKLTLSALASVADMITGTASKIVTAVNFKTYMDTYIIPNLDFARGGIHLGTGVVYNHTGFSSITKNGTGRADFVFTTAQPDTNYLISALCDNPTGVGGDAFVVNGSKSPSGFSIATTSGSGNTVMNATIVDVRCIR